MERDVVKEEREGGRYCISVICALLRCSIKLVITATVLSVDASSTITTSALTFEYTCIILYFCYAERERERERERTRERERERERERFIR